MSLSIQRNPVSELELQLPCCCTPMIGDGRRVLFSPETRTFTVESHLSALVPKCCMSVFQQEKRNREDLLTRNAIREILSTSRMNHLVEEEDSNNPTGSVTYAYFRSLQKKIFSLWQQTVVDTILVDKPVRNPLEGLPTDSSECDLNPLSTSRRINHSDTSSNASSIISENSDPNRFIENPLLRDQPRNFREDAVPQDQETFVAEQSDSLEGLLAHPDTSSNASSMISENEVWNLDICEGSDPNRFIENPLLRDQPTNSRNRAETQHPAEFHAEQSYSLEGLLAHLKGTPKKEETTVIPVTQLTVAQRKFIDFRKTNRGEQLLESKPTTSHRQPLPSRAIGGDNESPRIPRDSLGLSVLRTGQTAFPQLPSSGRRENQEEKELSFYAQGEVGPLPEMCESIGTFSDESGSH